MSFLILLMLHNPVNKLHNSYILMNARRVVLGIPVKNYWTRYNEQAGEQLFISTDTTKYFSYWPVNYEIFFENDIILLMEKTYSFAMASWSTCEENFINIFYNF